MENLTYSNSYSHHRQHNRKYVSRRSKRRVRLWVFAVPLLVFVLHFSWDDSFASANSNHQSNLTVNDTSNNVDDADDNNQACQMNSASSMLTAAIDGSFSETMFDESLLSAVETKLAHYLSASAVSAQNLREEKEKIKELIADISHQTKTPITNILLYAQLLSEQALPEASKPWRCH